MFEIHPPLFLRKEGVPPFLKGARGDLVVPDDLVAA